MVLSNRKVITKGVNGLKLVVGLGNPGAQYAKTRHNIGFMVIDYLAEQLNIKVDKVKFKSIIGEGLTGAEKVILAKPQTYMNLSGEAVLDMVQWYKLDTKDIIVIYDDMDLPAGKIRLRSQGSAGGHNGMKSIIYLVQTDKFPRLRVGIGRPDNQNIESVNFVLGKFSDCEAESMAQAVKMAADAVLKTFETGVERAMNEVNRE